MSYISKNYPPSVLPATRRIVAIGDLHGDYMATILALQKSNLIDSKTNWIGGDTKVIQVGDQLDRRIRADTSSDEDSEMAIMQLFDNLHEQARDVGGGVYSLIGNHELMNVMGDFSYVSPKGLDHFGGARGRYEKFKPGGAIARRMAKTRNVIMRVGDYIFVHGGVSPTIASRYNEYKINNIMRSYLQGNKRIEQSPIFQELYLHPNSLLWTRKYSEGFPDAYSLNQVLTRMRAKGLVVGHTPQEGGIRGKCRGKLWCIDTGMSEAFGKRRGLARIQVLEILNNGQRISVL